MPYFCQFIPNSAKVISTVIFKHLKSINLYANWTGLKEIIWFFEMEKCGIKKIAIFDFQVQFFRSKIIHFHLVFEEHYIRRRTYLKTPIFEPMYLVKRVHFCQLHCPPFQKITSKFPSNLIILKQKTCLTLHMGM